MASEIDHINLANRNHDILLHLLKDVDRFPEWTATVAFYKAVHVVEAVFSGANFHSTSHFVREKRLAQAQYKGIFKGYKHLLGASRIARYLANGPGPGFTCFTDFMTPEVVKEKLVKERLYLVEQQSLLHMSDAAKRLLIKINPADL